MVDRLKFYIDGAWVDPAAGRRCPSSIRRPRRRGEIALGTAADVDKALRRRGAHSSPSRRTTRGERMALLTRIIEDYKRRVKEIGAAISDEMGAPLPGRAPQAGAGLGHLEDNVDVLKNYRLQGAAGLGHRSCASRSASSA